MRQRRSSRILKKAQLRVWGLQTIDANLDFGNSLSLENLRQQIDDLGNKLMTHNTNLARIHGMKMEIKTLEKSLSALCERMLLGVAVKYGKDSEEYAMAGGVRKRDRVRKCTINNLEDVSE
ncbi:MULTISPECIES: hypothetical protein [Calothrix]|uniref:K-box domain-containing protein n=2 Tax=Calothrix TaxID=1186 RepID=A0ABR8ALX4_9CYAN|nr:MULTISPECIES: hypothetical protein [Calothrix]MBD2200245.1 hypothetical protein [Calothrix parietina FACHB-288]MBD2229218.1 hypothetical protein [Calothrix anomala FACHB-343]